MNSWNFTSITYEFFVGKILYFLIFIDFRKKIRFAKHLIIFQEIL